MKILMLTPYLPFPLSSGGQIRSFNLLKNLASKHEITLISLIKHDSEKEYIKNLRPYCTRIVAAKRPEKPWTLTNIVKTAFGKYPFLVVRNFSSEAKATVVDELRKNTFDLIHAETFYVMPHIPKTTIPVLLVEQTIEYLVYQHFVDTVKFKPLRRLLSLDVNKIQFWEEYYWRQAQRVVAMSEADRIVMRDRVSHLDVSIVPNGVDGDFFKFKNTQPAKNPTILFVGNFKWLQNKEAVNVLVNTIWPTISKQMPNARLWIVGRYPSQDILSLESKTVTVSSDIDDIRRAYEESDLLLAPIYGPGGTRYKILEAMACGVPVITTPWGIEGLGAKDQEQAIIRKDVHDLAQAAVDLLKDESRYTTLAKSANSFVRKLYNWTTIAQALDVVYKQVARHES